MFKFSWHGLGGMACGAAALVVVSTAGVLAPTAHADSGSGQKVHLTGAGATFPYPLYSKWISEYQKVDPKVLINYQPIGSGGGRGRDVRR